MAQTRNLQWENRSCILRHHPRSIVLSQSCPLYSFKLLFKLNSNRSATYLIFHYGLQKLFSSCVLRIQLWFHVVNSFVSLCEIVHDFSAGSSSRFLLPSKFFFLFSFTIFLCFSVGSKSCRYFEREVSKCYRRSLIRRTILQRKLFPEALLTLHLTVSRQRTPLCVLVCVTSVDLFSWLVYDWTLISWWFKDKVRWWICITNQCLSIFRSTHTKLI